MATIARLTADDAEAFRALRLEALRDHPEAFASDHAQNLRKPLSAFRDWIDSCLFLGAFAGDRLIGCAALERSDGAKLRHRGWIIAVYVTPGHRQQGIAGDLIEALIAHPLAQGLVQVELHVGHTNPLAHAFYARLGFVEVGREPRALRVAGRYLDEIHMVRTLDA